MRQGFVLCICLDFPHFHIYLVGVG